jgi:hypothetical protein
MVLHAASAAGVPDSRPLAGRVAGTLDAWDPSMLEAICSGPWWPMQPSCTWCPGSTLTCPGRSCARIYGGIHFRPAIERGMDQGMRIGQAVAELPLRC